jgi:hypothetical protein
MSYRTSASLLACVTTVGLPLLGEWYGPLTAWYRLPDNAPETFTRR